MGGGTKWEGGSGANVKDETRHKRDGIISSNENNSPQNCTQFPSFFKHLKLFSWVLIACLYLTVCVWGGGGGLTVLPWPVRVIHDEIRTTKHNYSPHNLLLYQNIKKTRPFDWFTNRIIYDSRFQFTCYNTEVYGEIEPDSGPQAFL